MKIHYLSFSKIPSRDANSVHVMKMCEAFSQIGHEVTLYAKKGDNNKISPFEYYGVSNNFNLKLGYFVNIPLFGDIIYGLDSLIKLFLSSTPDLYLGRHPHLLLLMSFRNKPIIYDTHDIAQSSLRKIIEKWICQSKNFKRLIVTSKISKREYIKMFPYLSSKNVVVARNAANPKNKAISPLKIPMRRGQTQIGYTGHLYPGRGIDIIFKIAESLPDCDFHIIGGTNNDLKRWMNKEKPNNIYFHGHVPPKLIPSYLNIFEILLAPYQRKVTIGKGKGDTSRWMCPLKIFDYMAAGKAIVASDLPSLNEILKHKRNSLLVKPENAESWVCAIKQLQSDVSLKTRISQNAYHDIQMNYTWKKRAEKILMDLSL